MNIQFQQLTMNTNGQLFIILHMWTKQKTHIQRNKIKIMNILTNIHNCYCISSHSFKDSEINQIKREINCVVFYIMFQWMEKCHNSYTFIWKKCMHIYYQYNCFVIFKLGSCFQDDCTPVTSIMKFINTNMSSEYSSLVTSLTNALSLISDILTCGPYNGTIIGQRQSYLELTIDENYMIGKSVHGYITTLERRYSVCKVWLWQYSN